MPREEQETSQKQARVRKMLRNTDLYYRFKFGGRGIVCILGTFLNRERWVRVGQMTVDNTFKKRKHTCVKTVGTTGSEKKKRAVSPQKTAQSPAVPCHLCLGWAGVR